MKWDCCSKTAAIMGGFSFVFGVAMLAGGYDAMFNAILKQNMAIVEGSRSFDIWRETPMPVYLRVFFFNLTNPYDFETHGAKPILQEVGPYVFSEYHMKEDVTFHENHTVSFFQKRWWYWEQEMSGNNSLDDVLTLVNTVPVSAAFSTPKILLIGFNMALNKIDEKIIVNKTMMEVMFSGFQDPLLDMVQESIVWDNGTFHNQSWVNELPNGLLDYDKFGWFYNRNESKYYDGWFNMYTGEDSIDNVGKIDLWNDSRKTPFFDAPCNEVVGSAGEMFTPGLDKTFIQFYSSDLCMSMKLFFKEEIEDKNGIPAYRYWGSVNTFANHTFVPEHKCFCVEGICAPTGLLNAQSCRMGSPAFISFPHFFNADPALLDQVSGLSPDPEKHAFTMDLIPELGIPVSVAARMQINMRIVPYKRVKILRNVPDVYLPLLWFEELAETPPDLAGQMKALLFIMHSPTMTIIFSIMVAVGILLIGLVVGLAFAHHKARKAEERLVLTDYRY
ncbi:protein croquemort-like [Oratosquilla oratoria]|uniref:protein croquemort-like n=1 Tax=Oratosquilla oratoria TaxID=337810 RepID=UPI003F75E2EB